MPTSTRKRVRQDVDSPGSLSKAAFPKRPRMGDQTPSLPSSDRITSPITSRTSSSSSSSSSSGTSGNEGSHAPSRASDPIYRRRARARQPREEAEGDTSSDESTSPESASSDVDTDTDDDEDDKKTSETEEVVPRLLALRKPQIHRVDRQPDLLERVSSFLPRMKAANDNLQQAIAAGRGDDMRVDNAGERNEGRYIEMVCCVLLLLLCWQTDYLLTELGTGCFGRETL